MTPYELLGGEPAVTALIEGLYRRAFADPLLKPFLEHIDQERLKSQQIIFTAQAIGGPQRYTGPSLQQAHKHLRIEQRHFDAFVAHLHSALLEIGADENLAGQLIEQTRQAGAAVVNTPSSAATSGS